MKFFAAFLIAFLAIHASTQSPITNDDSSTKEVLVELLTDLLKISSTLLSSAHTLLDEFKANEKNATESLADLVVQKLQNLNAVFVGLIDELKDGATDQGLAVLACLDAEQANVNDAIRKAALILSNNTFTELPLVTDLAQVVLSQASELQEDVQLLVDTLDTCDSSDTICLALFVASATNIIKEAVDNVQEDIADLISISQAIISDIQAWDISGTIREDIQAIFNDAVVCIYS